MNPLRWIVERVRGQQQRRRDQNHIITARTVALERKTHDRLSDARQTQDAWRDMIRHADGVIRGTGTQKG